MPIGALESVIASFPTSLTVTVERPRRRMKRKPTMKKMLPRREIQRRTMRRRMTVMESDTASSPDDKVEKESRR